MACNGIGPRLPSHLSYYRAVLAVMTQYAREWGSPVETLLVEFGQSRSCRGEENNYVVSDGTHHVCISVAGSKHQADRRMGARRYDGHNLTRPYTFAEILDLSGPNLARAA